ncbi:cell division protein SepF [Candidatus Woesearchaeota archaeon]|nr:cell division protein SepF [Candidatus Woesearchaeota archaeon]
MREFLSKLKKKLTSPSYEDLEQEEGYVEIDTDVSELKAKAVVRPFQVEEFEDLKPILDSLREGKTIAIINIKPIKDKDIVELKRAVNKLKKTADAIGGEIAGFGEDYLIVTPGFAKIYRSKQTKTVASSENTNSQE